MKRLYTSLRAVAAVVAFGAFICFLALLCLQLYHWLRDGEWTHIGIRDGLLSLVSSCCTHADGSGLGAQFQRWLEAPESWLGWHRVLEVVPATVGLFLLSVFGNFAYIYCSDRLEEAVAEARHE